MPKILESLQNPKGLKSLTRTQLKELAEEIRGEIIKVVSRTGGHLASSLGAVELAIALHCVLDTPRDKIIWDVGHQAYAHKLLTGRFSRFETLRQTGGLSGFLKRSESEYDTFGAGHASTSIAAALGMARARDIKKEDNKVVAVIGDGSMTCGLVYEALNTAGTLGTNFMVILNDNEMSIAENVGAIPLMFNRIITGDWYNVAKSRLEGLLYRLRAGPHRIGEGIIKISHRIEESIKGLIVPGLFFEELGFRYIGPIDGNNLDILLPALKKTVEFKGRRILHITTKKGKGYTFAEKNPESFHSAPPFIIQTGKPRKSSGLTFTKVFGDIMVELAGKDERIIAITAAMPGGTGLSEFARRFPERFYDFGIAEGAAVIAAAGMACEGLRPVVAIYSTFLQRAFDMVIHDVALQNLPVVFALDRGGIVGRDGPTHHGTFDLSYLRIIPNMTIMAPRNEAELRNMMVTALAKDDGPAAIRYPRGRSGLNDIDITHPARALPIGKGEWLREGKDAAILGAGVMTNNALAAADLLTDEGIKVAVADARFIKPLDEEMILRAVEKHPLLFTIEDNVAMGGFGSAVNEFLAARGLDRHFTVIALPDHFVEHGTPADLYKKYGLSPGRIAERIREVVISSPEADCSAIGHHT